MWQIHWRTLWGASCIQTKLRRVVEQFLKEVSCLRRRCSFQHLMESAEYRMAIWRNFYLFQKLWRHRFYLLS